MTTITVSAFAFLPQFSIGLVDTITVVLFSQKFPSRNGTPGIVLSARAITSNADGSLMITVGRGDHLRSFCVRLDVGKSAK